MCNYTKTGRIREKVRVLVLFLMVPLWLQDPEFFVPIDKKCQLIEKTSDQNNQGPPTEERVVFLRFAGTKQVSKISSLNIDLILVCLAINTNQQFPYEIVYWGKTFLTAPFGGKYGWSLFHKKKFTKTNKWFSIMFTEL